LVISRARKVPPAKRAKTGHHGGSGKCLAFSLPAADQSRLKDELLRGTALYKLAKKWGINRQSLRNHREKHLSPADMALTADRPPGKTLDQAEEVVQQTQAMYESARTAGNIVLGLKALAQRIHALELVAKLRGELDERPQVTVNLQTTQEWIRIQTVVLRFVDERLSAEDAVELSRRLRVLDRPSDR